MEIKAQKNTEKPHYPAVIKKTAVAATAAVVVTAAVVLTAASCQTQSQPTAPEEGLLPGWIISK